MEGLFLLQGRVRRAASGGFLGSSSNLAHSSSGLTFDCSECSDSECGGSGPSSRRIALAKRVLSEATRAFTPCLSISAQKADMCKNTGAIGPLMSMIQSECDDQALRCCLDTLSFLLLDKANRKVVHELSGLSLLMSLFTRETDWTLLRMVLDCVCSLVKNDDAEKERVWAHAGKDGILGLMNAHASAPHLLEVLCHIRKISFKGQAHAMTLLEPQLLLAASCILAKHHQPYVVVAKVCKFLRWCAEAAGPEHIELWALVLPLVVPLLRDPCTCEGALAVLLSLSAHEAYKPLFATVGAVPAVLALIAHPTKSICNTASCVISALAEDAGPCRNQMATESCLGHLLRALSAVDQYPDVIVAVLYTLNKLVKYHPIVTSLLTQRGLPRLLMRLMPRWTDTELTMGAMQLIEAMGVDPEALLSSSACSSSVPSPHQRLNSQPSLGLEVSATSLLCESRLSGRDHMNESSDLVSMSTGSALTLPTFHHSVTSNVAMMDALGNECPFRQASGSSDATTSSAMSFSTSLQVRPGSQAVFSEEASPLGGDPSRPVADAVFHSAAATAFLSLQRRHATGVPAAPVVAVQPHLRHPSRGGSSDDASLFPSRSSSPSCGGSRSQAGLQQQHNQQPHKHQQHQKQALPPLQQLPLTSEPSAEQVLLQSTAAQISLPAEPRNAVGLRSWSCTCLTALDGRILA